MRSLSWALPVLVVPKHDGSFRVCVDFRSLNALVKVDPYPMPRFSNYTHRLAGKIYFTTLDLAQGYHNIAMSPESVSKTGFVTPDGHVEYLKMPFGLNNAGATFQRCLEIVLAVLKLIQCMVYIDDISIMSKTFEEHLEHLENVFTRLEAADLRIEISKCNFASHGVKVLGHIINVEGIKSNPQKTEAIANWVPPTNVKEVRQFLGLVSYYRQFIENFSAIVDPIKQNLNGKFEFQWTSVRRRLSSSNCV